MIDITHALLEPGPLKVWLQGEKVVIQGRKKKRNFIYEL